MSIEKIYEQKCKLRSDINEHLPTLKRYTEECEHITEMGVRFVVSTYAFLAGKPKKLISIDYNDIPQSTKEYLMEESKKQGTDFNFVKGDTTKIEIEETDFLFIDTLHHYDQLKVELEKHGNKARKYLGFHDTTSFETIGEVYTPPGVIDGKEAGKGLWKAIEEFLESNPHWKLHERFTNNNGLTILKRV